MVMHLFTNRKQQMGYTATAIPPETSYVEVALLNLREAERQVCLARANLAKLRVGVFVGQIDPNAARGDEVVLANELNIALKAFQSELRNWATCKLELEVQNAGSI